jgi:anaphase-promoting complex subunit 2
VEVEATPLQASIVELFEASSEMTVESLRQGLGVSESLVKAGLAWWRERGVLKEVSDGSDSRWTLLEVAE